MKIRSGVTRLFQAGIFAAIAVCVLPFSTFAASVTVSVDGTAMPWLWTSGGLNTGFQFGVQDGSGPTVVSVLSGSTVTVSYVSGLTSAFGGTPDVDGNGYVGSIFADDNPGSSLRFFPSLYMGPYPPDVFLQALVGAFTDSTGAIIGNPFAVDNGPLSLLVPVGATQIQLGVNDDIFSDNTGSLRVLVDGASSVPEPSAFLLLGTGLSLLAIALLKRRQQADQ